MRIRNISLMVFLFVSLLLGSAITAQAAPQQTSIPPNITFHTVVTGLTSPVLATNAGDGSGRIFIVQQTGQILILKGTTLNATPFLDVSTLINCCGEQGLLGLAFDPHYSTNGYFYIVYTNQHNVGDDVLYRYHVSSDPDVADATSGQLLLTVAEPEANHNGGNIAFGPDGYLYFGLGDGGGGGDNHGTIGNGQDKNTLLGKILRINVDSTFPYTIPADNPFASGGGSPEIWSYGVRNPWRFSFDKTTGDLYIGDVGQDTEEEIDFQAAGAAGGQNYGWRIREGNLCYNPSTGCGTPPGYVPPVSVYTHGTNDSTGCAVTGGYVYRGTQFPALQGVYLFGDYCSGKVWGMYKNASNQWVTQLIATTSYNISSFGQDEAGELYILDLNGNLIHITHSPIIAATFISRPITDGYINESRQNSGVGGAMNSDATELVVGDSKSNTQFRAIVSFNTSALPDTAVIYSATLNLTQMNISGGDPFAALGQLVADSGNPFFGSSPQLELQDFNAPAGLLSSVMFSNTPVGGVYSARVAKAAFSHISLNSFTDFRLRFTLSTNGDHANNRLSFWSGSAGMVNRPQLVIRYYVP